MPSICSHTAMYTCTVLLCRNKLFISGSCPILVLTRVLGHSSSTDAINSVKNYQGRLIREKMRFENTEISWDKAQFALSSGTKLHIQKCNTCRDIEKQSRGIRVLQWYSTRLEILIEFLEYSCGSTVGLGASK